MPQINDVAIETERKNKKKIINFQLKKNLSDKLTMKEVKEKKNVRAQILSTDFRNENGKFGSLTKQFLPKDE